MKISGHCVEIGDLCDPAGTPHGIAINTDAGQHITILGLTKEQCRELVEHFMGDVQLSIGATA